MLSTAQTSPPIGQRDHSSWPDVRLLDPEGASLRCGSGETSPRLQHSLSSLESTTLEELDGARLHDRVESKLVMPASAVPATLLRLRGDYFVMEHQSKRLQSYSNTYFDTAELKNYHEHHNQKRQRSKVRYRTYVDSELTYFEVKRNVDGRTVKERKASASAGASIHADDIPFLNERMIQDSRDLRVSVVVAYDRILLVSRSFDERVTIDLNLRFRSASGAAIMPELAIVEFKQPELDRQSPAIKAIPRQTQMFSKYCMGLASCDPSLKRNRFKKVFLGLDRLGAAPQRIGAAA